MSFYNRAFGCGGCLVNAGSGSRMDGIVIKGDETLTHLYTFGLNSGSTNVDF